jgi:aspartate/methionine/tyrosine aminotransferase
MTPVAPPFSRRTDWPGGENALTQAVAERRRRNLPVVDLTESNPTRVGLELPLAEVAQALNCADNGRYAPEPFGLLHARQALAREVYRDRVAARQVVLTASTSEAYAFLFKLLCDPGDEVLVPAPSYPLFEYLAGLESVVPVPCPARPVGGDWPVDVAELERRCTPRTRALLVVSPHNPTGAVLRREELNGIADLCARRGLALIADEVFADTWTPRAHAAGDRVESVAGETRCLTFALGGLSKACLLPQLKLGWMAVSGPEPALSQALERLEVIADTWLSVGTPVQQALPRLLQLKPAIQAALRQRLEANRATLEAAFRNTEVTVLPADGGWSAVLRVPCGEGEEALALDLIEREGLIVHPGYFFDFPSEGWLVVGLLLPTDVFADALHRLAHHVLQEAGTEA